MITVILPVWNAAATIARAVNSVLSQTHSDLELIVVNDGSTDSTVEILHTIAEHDHRLRIVNIEHSGVAEAFNTGLHHAKGKYLARMDADDLMHPERIAKQAKYLDEHHEIGVVSSLVEFGGDRKTQEGYALHVDWINTLITPEEIAMNRFVESPVCNPSVMFRQELVSLYGAARTGEFPEDYEMWLRWMDAGVQFTKIPEVLFTWNDLPSRLTRNDARYSAEAFERAKTDYLMKYIKKNNPTKRKLFLCGAGRVTRKKSAFLIASGLTIGGYIDVDPGKIGKDYDGIKVIALEDLPATETCYVVSYVGNRGARKAINRALQEKGFEEGRDFVMAG